MDGKDQISGGGAGGGEELNKKRLLLEVSEGSLMWLIVWVLAGLAALVLLLFNLLSVDDWLTMFLSYGWIISAFYELLISVRERTRRQRASHHGLHDVQDGHESIQRILIAMIQFIVSVIGFVLALRHAMSKEILNSCFTVDSIIGSILGLVYMVHNRNDVENYRVHLDIGPLAAIEAQNHRLQYKPQINYKPMLLDLIKGSWSWLLCWVAKCAAAVVLVTISLAQTDSTETSIGFILVTHLFTLFSTGFLLVYIRDYLRKDRAERYQVGNPLADLTSVGWGALKGRIAAATIATLGSITLFVVAVSIADPALSKSDLFNSIYSETSVISSTMGLLFVLHNRADAEIYTKL